MNNSDKTHQDWIIILLAVWLTSRLFWTCDPSGFAFDYLWGLLGMSGAACWFFFKKDNRGQFTVSDLLVGLFFCLTILSGTLGIINGDQRAALNCVWSSTFYALCYLLVRQIVTSPERKRILLSSLITGAIVLSTWAIYQRYVEYPADKANYLADPTFFLQQAGIDPSEDSPVRRSFEDRFFAFEPTASFALTNSLAVFLIPSFFLLAVAWTQKWDSRAAWGLLIAIGAVGFVTMLTHSRAAALGVGTALFFGFAYGICRVPGHVNSKITLFSLFFFFSVLAGFLAILWKPSMLDSALLTLEYRFEYWETALQIIGFHPWLGVGAGNFQNFYTQFMPCSAGEAVADPHNFLLEIAATAGIPATLAFWAILGWLGYRLVNHTDDSETSDSYLTYQTSCIVSLSSVVLGFCLGFVALGQAPGPFVVLLPVSIGVPLILTPGIRQATFSPIAMGLAGVGLLTALMFSGGILYTTIALVFWTLLALIVNEVDPAINASVPEESNSSQPASRVKPIMSTVGLLALFGLCYATGFYPTTLSAQARAESLNSKNAEAQLTNLEKAAKADPMSFQIRYDLAQWNWFQWTYTHQALYLDACVNWFHESIERNPRSSVLWREYGIRMYRYGRESGDWSHENDAYNALSRACYLHQADYVARAYLALLNLTSPVLTPNQEELCSKALSELKVSDKTLAERRALVTAALLKKRRQDAVQWAQELVQFSDQNVHKNRKIPASLRKELIQACESDKK